MTDLSDTIEAKSDQLNSDDLVGGEITITITDVSKVTGDQPISIHYNGCDGKPYKPCKTMRRALVAIWGKDGSKYIGRQLTLYRDPTVKWAGMDVGGIRISHASNIDKEQKLMLTATRGKKTPTIIKPLVTKPSIDLVSFESEGKSHAEKGVGAYTSWIGTLDEAHKSALRGDINKRLTAIAKAVPVETEEEELAV